MRQRRARDNTWSAGRPACTRRRCATSSLRNALALALLSTALTGSAHAQIEIEGCGDVDPGAVAALVSIELDSYGEAARAYRARLVCAERAIEIRVDDEITGKRVERSATLAPDDPEPARTIALLVSELVLASWAELALDIVESDHRPARVEATRVIERRLRAHPNLSVGIHASAAGRVRDPNEPYPTLFVDLAGAVRYDWFAVFAGLWIEIGSAARTRGDVEHLAFGGSLGPSVVLSLLERLELGMTLLFDLGLVSLEGAPTGERVAGENASAIGAAVRFEAALRFLVGVVALGAFLEVGYQFAGLTGEVSGEPDVDPNGLFAGGGVRIALESPRR